MLHAVAPDKPWLTYYAPGTAHAPHHAPKEWIAKFKGQFDMGWDKMREITLAKQKRLGVVPPRHAVDVRSPGIPAWDSLDADHKKVYAHMMEVYAAAFPTATTRWAGFSTRLRKRAKLDNTLVIYIQGDNGASAEGGLQGLLNEMSVFNGVPEDFKQLMAPHGRSRRADDVQPLSRSAGRMRWTRRFSGQAGCLALRRHAQRPGHLLARRIKDKGGIRTQFHHVIDIAPTILEAVGVQSPWMLNGVPQKPIEGVSMVYTFDDAKARPSAAPSISRCSATAPFTRTAGSPAPRRHFRRGRRCVTMTSTITMGVVRRDQGLQRGE